MSRKKVEFALSTLIVLFLCWILWEARNWPAPSKLFPWSLGVSVLALALAQLAAAWRAVLKEARPRDLPGSQNEPGRAGMVRNDNAAAARPGGKSPLAMDSPAPSRDSDGWRVATICGWIIAFFLGIWLMGFKASSLLLTFAFMKFTAREKWLISATMAVGSWLFFWLVFEVALQVPLDNGVIGDYLGMH